MASQTSPEPLPPLPLPEGITSRYLNTAPLGLNYHILEAGSSSAPLILLLHGFPEIAFSYRKILPLLAAAGFHAIAFDQRGYGRTTGWDTRSYDEVDLSSFAISNAVRDVVIVVQALGYTTVRCVVGHDFGAVPAAAAAMIRPDIFESVVLMSHPFKGPPKLEFPNLDASSPRESDAKSDIHADLAAMGLKHYKWYYSSPPAGEEMHQPTASLHEFLRGYFHLKSADWDKNKPYALEAWSASELAKMPYYYIMPLNASMRDAVAKDMQAEDPNTVAERSARWLPDADLAVYVSEYTRTGYQGGLNWYRAQTNPKFLQGLHLYSGKKLEPPCKYICGAKDWGTYQEPGVVERMSKVCVRFRGVKTIENAGHWVTQEAPQQVVDGILELVSEL